MSDKLDAHIYRLREEILFQEIEIHRLRTERDALLEALKGVLRVADRKTDEFDAARAAIAMVEGDSNGGPHFD